MKSETSLGFLPLAASHIGLAILAAVGGYFFALATAGRTKPVEGEATLARGAVAVTTAPVERTVLERVLKLTGTVAPEKKVIVLPRLAGRIVELKVKEGDAVRGGETVLAVIEHEELDAQKKAAAAAVEVARAQVLQMEVGLRQARKDLGRVLVLNAQGGASDEVVEKAQAAVESLVAQKNVVKKQIEQLKANAEIVDLRLRDAQIVSPADGVLTNLYDFDVGDTVAPTVPFCEVAVLARVRVLLVATEDDLAAAREGKEVRLTIPALPGQSFRGEIEELPQSLDPRTRAGLVKVGVDNEKGLLMPGISVTAGVIIEKREGTLVVPDSALVSRKGSFVAYVVEEGTARERDVKPGLRASGSAEILSGLAEGDAVVTGGAKMLGEGTMVKVVDR